MNPLFSPHILQYPISQILLGHIIPEVISFSNMTNDQLVETEAKVPVRTNVYETEGHTLHTFNGSPSLDERPASNGILHVVSDLVYPPLEYTIAEVSFSIPFELKDDNSNLLQNLKLDPRFSALKMAVEAAGLMDTVENGKSLKHRIILVLQKIL